MLAHFLGVATQGVPIDVLDEVEEVIELLARPLLRREVEEREVERRGGGLLADKRVHAQPREIEEALAVARVTPADDPGQFAPVNQNVVRIEVAVEQPVRGRLRQPGYALGEERDRPAEYPLVNERAGVEAVPVELRILPMQDTQKINFPRDWWFSVTPDDAGSGLAILASC